jgi:hypothetical protein
MEGFSQNQQNQQNQKINKIKISHKIYIKIKSKHNSVNF